MPITTASTSTNVEKSRVIAIDFSSANPDLAARVANTIAETYLTMQQSAKQDQTRAAGNWLAGEIEKMRKKVEDAEAKVEEYRSKSNLFVGSNNTSLPSQQLTETQFADRLPRAARKPTWKRAPSSCAP